MRKREFHFPSCDKETTIHGVEWIPEGKPVAVLQMCHGMTEYILRYDEFATYLAHRGIYVVGHDHLGHGQSVLDADHLGYFHENDGNQCLIGDIHKVRKWAQKNHPGIPYFILGHSMGSFLVRQYLTMYSEGLSGAIIMGTGEHNRIELEIGQVLCRLMAKLKGWKFRSFLVNHIACGSFNQKFKPAETGVEWLSRNKENCRKFIHDPYCTFVFSVNAYYYMFEGMKVLERKDSVNKIPKDLPVFFVSGEDDPVGNFGKSVRKVCQKYRDAGIKDVDIKLYRDDRHEILNEVDRMMVYEDLYLWLCDKIDET